MRHVGQVEVAVFAVDHRVVGESNVHLCARRQRGQGKWVAGELGGRHVDGADGVAVHPHHHLRADTCGQAAACTHREHRRGGGGRDGGGDGGGGGGGFGGRGGRGGGRGGWG